MKLSAKILADLLVKECVIHPDAVNNPEGFDGGVTMEGIRQVADELNLRESQQTEKFRNLVLQLRIEVSCRIQHGAESGGHLEYVQKQLDEILTRL